MRSMVVTLVVLTSGVPVAGQQSSRSLTRPDATFDEPFTAVRGVRELTDGRVLVSDLREKIVMLVDLRNGTATRVGREGQGPGEYGLPGTLLPLPDGQTLLQDFGNRRFLAIGADGSVGATLTPPQPPATPGHRGGIMLAAGLVDGRGVDSQGRLYFQGLAAPGSETSPDSLPILRWDRRATGFDTVAWLPVTADMRPRVTRQGSDRMMVRIGSNRAWPRQLQWAVASDGRIAMVNPEPYRVTWVGPRGAQPGPILPYNPIKVTEAEKRAYREAMSRATPVVVAFGGGPNRAVGPPPQVGAEEPEWPESLPPFSGRDAVQVTPDGEVWVVRLQKAGESAPRIDVFDAAGRQIGTVTLRPRSRVVGFGSGTVYVVRRDDDDLEYLERFRL